MISGYDAQYRYSIIKAVLDRVQQCEDDIGSGNRVRNRNRKQIEADKARKSGKFNNTWFLSGNKTVVLNVPITPGGELANKLGKAVGDLKGPDNGTTKIVESSGQLITAGLTKSDPFKVKECPYPTKCIAKHDVDCTTNRSVYRIDCKLCQAQVGSGLSTTMPGRWSGTQSVSQSAGEGDAQTANQPDAQSAGQTLVVQSAGLVQHAGQSAGQLANQSAGQVQLAGQSAGQVVDTISRPPTVTDGSDGGPLADADVLGSQVCAYVGTSGHTVHKRAVEHAQSVWRRDGKSALSKHHKYKHPEVTFDTPSDISEMFEASVIKNCFKFNTQRYISESLEIEKVNNDPHTVLLNNRSEWGNNKVRRLVNR